jgi:hypothetical protein
MRRKIVQACLLGCLILPVQSSPAIAEISIRPGIWCNREKRNRVSDTHEDQLVRSLRRITGFQRLIFAEDGALSLGDVTDVASGSSIARQIIFCAMGSGKTFIIEDHSGSQSVFFGQLDEGTDFEDIASKQKLDIWRLRIDFEDFQEIDAPSEVRESFDVGFTLLHELLHGVGYKDADSQEEIGELEGLVNQARAELGLPLRDQYFGEPLQITPQIATVRLRFRKEIKHGYLKRPIQRLHYLFYLLPAGYQGDGATLIPFYRSVPCSRSPGRPVPVPSTGRGPSPSPRR